MLNFPLLDSAAMTPQQSFDGHTNYDTLTKIAAAYMAGLALNHPFENGNKRVALTVGSVFVRLNGYKLTLDQQGAEQLILDLVSHKINRAEAAAILERNVQAL